MKPNAVNVHIQKNQTMRFEPQITKVNEPKSIVQKIAHWIGNKAGLFQPHISKKPVITYKTIEIDGDTIVKIKRSIIAFMDTYNVNPQTDLVILFGKNEYSEHLGKLTTTINTDLWFSKDGLTYKGIDVKCVPYINGVLVLLKKDLI